MNHPDIDPWIEALGPERQAALAQIGRYSMYRFVYRTSVADHAHRVARMFTTVWPIVHQAVRNFDRHGAADNFDYQHGYRLALVHDDIEAYPDLSDVQAGLKALMTVEEKQELSRKEFLAIGYVIDRFGRTNSSEYRQLLEDALSKTSLLAQLVCGRIDKTDAWCEAVHEATAGNPDVTERKANQRGELAPLPFHHYPAILAAPYCITWPGATIDFGGMHPFLGPIPIIDHLAVARAGRPHTGQSISHPTGITLYDAWKAMILSDPAADASWLWTPTTRTFPNCRS